MTTLRRKTTFAITSCVASPISLNQQPRLGLGLTYFRLSLFSPAQSLQNRCHSGREWRLDLLAPVLGRRPLRHAPRTAGKLRRVRRGWHQAAGAGQLLSALVRAIHHVQARFAWTKGLCRLALAQLIVRDRCVLLFAESNLTSSSMLIRSAMLPSHIRRRRLLVRLAYHLLDLVPRQTRPRDRRLVHPSARRGQPVE